ncbi:MAG: GNAT family N-acetyltransferase [Sphingomonadaceae bacterium]|nr:GNAT family N-acetyltransferase [Sphingomonadaceae bacterium]
MTVRPFVRSDAVEVARFASSLPEHDLLFLNRDIQNARVVGAWLDAVDRGEIESLIALAGDRAVATTAIVRDMLGWSAHVAEIRMLVAPEWRGKGLGRALLEATVGLASESGAEKLVARMTPDQAGAITLFEEAGFRGEAMLRDHVRDRAGQLHDLAILSLGLARAAGRSEAYGG